MNKNFYALLLGLFVASVLLWIMNHEEIPDDTTSLRLFYGDNMERGDEHGVYSNSSLTPNKRKRFAYLTQTEQCLPLHWLHPHFLGNGFDLDVFVLSYKKKCIGWDSIDHIHHFYNANTTTNTSWTTGRNMIYNIASQYSHYEYFLIFDDDVLLIDDVLGDNGEVAQIEAARKLFQETLNRRVSVLRTYEQFLLSYRPFVSSPNFCIGKAACARIFQSRFWSKRCGKDKVKKGWLPWVMYTRQFDAAFNAFRNDAAKELLPYDASRDNWCWWESQVRLIMLIAARGRKMVKYFKMSSYNPIHRPYPRGGITPVLESYNLLNDEEKKNLTSVEKGFILRNDLRGFWHNSDIICIEVERNT